MFDTTTCPTCGSIDLDFNTFELVGKQIECPCKEQKEKAMHYRKERANIPKEYWRIGVEEYEGDQRVKKEVLEYLACLDTYFKKNIGLFLWGTHGTGKTFLATYILKEAIARGYKNVRFTCLSDVISQYTAAWYSDEEQKEFYNKMMDSQFLVIDDVSKEYKARSNLAESVFDKVLRYREHPTIITSNKALENIESIYGQSIVSLMYGKLISIRFAGTDFRKEEISKRLKAEGKKPIELELIR